MCGARNITIQEHLDLDGPQWDQLEGISCLGAAVQQEFFPPPLEMIKPRPLIKRYPCISVSDLGFKVSMLVIRRWGVIM